MANGSYPLDPRHSEGGRQLKAIAVNLRNLLENSGPYGSSPLPKIYDNTPEDAASDGQYTQLLYLAVEFIERCIRPET